MMTDELAVYEPQSFDRRSLSAWVEDAGAAHQLAKLLVTTAFVPASYEGRADQAAAAILTGMELGLSPIASLRSIDIIKGTPAMRAIALRAVVQSNGHAIWTEESTAVRCVVAAQRRDSDKVERSLWTIERASKLGLLSRDNWKSQPIAMLLARATSEVARLVAADALLGIPYSVEELEDAASAADVVALPRATTRVKRRAVGTATQTADPAQPADDDVPTPQTADSDDAVVPPQTVDDNPPLLLPPDDDGGES
jgi:hypothetical protein